jgi:hypothetical protein
VTDGAGASDAGRTAGARSERRGWARARGRSEKRTTQGGRACGGMAAVANAEWARMDDRTTRVGRYFLEKDVGDVERKEAGLVGHAGPGRRRPIRWTPALEHYKFGLGGTIQVSSKLERHCHRNFHLCTSYASGL